MPKKGRNSELIRKRDAKLCQRYYYWTEVQRLRFDDALRILSQEEFFLSEERIMCIIRRHARSGTQVLTLTRQPKRPRLTISQLSLFTDAEGSEIAPLRRGK